MELEKLNIGEMNWHDKVNSNSDVIKKEIDTLNDNVNNYNLKTYTSFEQIGLSDSDFSATDWVYNVELLLSKLAINSRLSVYFYEISPNISASILNEIGVSSGILTVHRASNNAIPNKFTVQMNNTNREVYGFYDNTWLGFNPISYMKDLPCPNLLINSNFKVSEMINQRGVSKYTIGEYASKYIFDMFRMYKTDSDTTVDGYVDLTGENVKIVQTTGSVGGIALQQKIENYKSLAGKTLTLSVKAKSSIVGDALSLYFGIDGLTSGFKTFKAVNTSFNTYSITITIPENISASVDIIVHNKILNGSLEIEYIKLEENLVATKFYDDDKATKLAKCQRYFIKYSLFKTVGADVGQMVIEFDVAMRTTPTFTVLENLYAHKIDGSAVQLICGAGYTQTGAGWGKVGARNTEVLYLQAGSNPLMTGIVQGVYNLNNVNSVGNIVSGFVNLEISAEM